MVSLLVIAFLRICLDPWKKAFIGKQFKSPLFWYHTISYDCAASDAFIVSFHWTWIHISCSYWMTLIGWHFVYDVLLFSNDDVIMAQHQKSFHLIGNLLQIFFVLMNGKKVELSKIDDKWWKIFRVSSSSIFISRATHIYL